MRFCVAANLCCVDMITEAFQRSRAIQTNNERFAIRLGYQEFDVFRRDYLDSREAIHALYQQQLRRLNRGNDQRSPKQQARRIHRSDSPGIPLVQRAVGTFVAMIDDPVGGTERNY